MLALLSVLGAAVLALTVLLLGVGVASGSEVAGWVLGLTLLLGLFGAVWTVRRASALLSTGHEFPPPGELPSADEARLRALYSNERALPVPARAVFRRTVLATRDALYASAGDTTLERDTYDVRQTAREDLPALLDAYRSAPRSAGSDAEFARQLTLIETRMRGVARERGALRERQLRAHGRYLDDKYEQADQPAPRKATRE